MAHVIVSRTEPRKVYAGPDKGWLDLAPPQETTPEELAQKFDTKDAAEEYIKRHQMQADATPIS